MKTTIAFLCALLVTAPTTIAAVADDFRALTRDVPAISTGAGSVPGQVAVIGRLAFPVAADSAGAITVGAGCFGDVPTGGRVTIVSHTSLLDTRTPAMRTWVGNLVGWIGRGERPVIALGPGIAGRDWGAVAGTIRTVRLPLTADALRGAAAVVLSLNQANLDSSLPALRRFAGAGGGVVISGTPWAARAEFLCAANDFLDSAGLAFHTAYAAGGDYLIAKSAPSPLRSARNAIEALVRERQGGAALSLADRAMAASAVELALAARPDSPALKSELTILSDAYGWIQAGKAQPLRKDARPVEAMLARHQANHFNLLPPEKLFPHPGAADWPGPVAADAPVITRRVRVPAVTGPDRLINHGQQGRKVNTGVYAPPGAMISIHLPPPAVGAGLSAIIGVHTDETFHLKRWNRFPKISREWPLTAMVNRVGGVFGGLVILRVPPECALGEIEVTVAGGVAAPAFVLGETTNADWNAGLKNAPGAWGYLESKDFCSYVPREVLQRVDDPESVAHYWQTVMETADRHLGYDRWRRRGEGGYTDRDISAGYGHAGYPVVMAYGSGDALVKGGPDKGDWGFLHEIGHTFQDSFDGHYTIATHAEVDVNLVPGLVKMLVHDVTCIDNNAHPTFNAKTRLAAVQAFLAQPADKRTWDIACKSPAAYDFYFTLAECFGWDLYQRAFGRLMNFLQRPGSEPELHALDARSPHHKRDRFFLLFCQESGRNLLPHFQKYGLDRGEFGLSPAVVAKVRELPEWSGNQPVKLARFTKPLEVRANAAAGTVVHRFIANDPDAGTIFTWSMSGGNGAFALHKRTGELTLAKPAELRPGTHKLNLTVSDSTVPATTDTVAVEIVVR